MTKLQLIDLVRKRFNMEYLDKRYIELVIGRAWSQLLNDVYNKNVDYLDFYAKEYTAQTVTLNSTTGRYYANFPAQIVNLQDPAEGVRVVSTTDGSDLEFVPISATEARYMKDLEVDLIDTLIQYVVYYDKIEFFRNMTASIASEGVNMSLVIPFEEYDYDEKIPIPHGQDNNLLIMVAQFLQGTVPENELNN